jgi:hypothetical protein
LPTLFVILCPKSFAADDGKDSWNNLFSFANKNLLASGVPKEIEGANKMFVLKI